MRIVVLVTLLFVICDCGYQHDMEIKDAALMSMATAINSPTPEVQHPRIPEIALKPLDKHQKKRLDSTLPRKVREVLEKAETLDVLGLSSEEKAGIGWYPDIRVSLAIGEKRTELLNAFFFDASAGPNPSACFIPRHGFEATYKGNTVKIIICYQCHLFAVKGDLGEFGGGVYYEGAAAHHLFESILGPKRINK